MLGRYPGSTNAPGGFKDLRSSDEVKILEKMRMTLIQKMWSFLKDEGGWWPVGEGVHLDTQPSPFETNRKPIILHNARPSAEPGTSTSDYHAINAKINIMRQPVLVKVLCLELL